MFEVIQNTNTVQELQLVNRKRLRYFNKILETRANKKPHFKPADFEIYEPQREKIEDNWRGRKLKAQQTIVALTEEEKEEQELIRLRELAYFANLEGTSLDNIMNFQSKTPEKWMEKWEKNLIIDPKYVSTVVDFDDNRELSAGEVR